MKIKDIAKIAGVSIATVSKIINNKDESINSKTRERVLKIVKEYNYVPYGNIKNNGDTRSFIIALLLKENLDDFFLNEIIKRCQEKGYSIMIYISENNNEKELQNITSICKHKVDGVIWQKVSSSSEKYSDYFIENNIKILNLENFFPNNETIINKIICLFSEYGHQKIIFYQENNKVLEKNYFDFNKDIVFANKENITALLSEGNTAVLSPNYWEAIALYNSLVKFKYSIPEEISICSIKNSQIKFNEISAFEIPVEKISQNIVTHIINLCENLKENYENIKVSINHLNTINNLKNSEIKKILVVGSINIDISLKVNELPSIGNTAIIKNKYICLGGKGANQAIGVAKLQQSVSLIGKIGDDNGANLALSELLNYKIDISGVVKEKNCDTGEAYIQIQKNGNSTISIFPGANNLLFDTDIEKLEYLFKTSTFCLLQSEIPLVTVKKVIELATKYEVKIIFKPSSLNDFPLELLKYIYIFIPNNEEASILSSLENIEDKAEYFFKKGAKNVIITLGENGCYLKNETHSKYFKTIKITPIDTTGASDAFISALATYLNIGKSLETSIQIANYAAGISTTREGVINSLIDKTSLEKYVEKISPNLLEK